MNTRCVLMRVLCFSGIVLLMGVNVPASAVEMSVYVTNPYQVMSGGTVGLGHVVTASTNYNRLTAGGTYEARCAHPDLPLSAPGQRTISASAFLGGLRLVVTIPTQLPAYHNIPGFSALPRGTIVECQYVWTAEAVEGGYNLGGGGIGVPVGQGVARDGSIRDFRMRVPGTADGEDDACIP